MVRMHYAVLVSRAARISVTPAGVRLLDHDQHTLYKAGGRGGGHSLFSISGPFFYFWLLRAEKRCQHVFLLLILADFYLAAIKIGRIQYLSCT